MLLRVVFENFLSFNDSVQFDLFPNPKRTYLSSHIYDGDRMPVLKMSAVYGNVGAGKTNIIKGMLFLKNLVQRKNFLNDDIVNSYFFRLKQDAGQNPFSMKVEFENEGHYFFYEVQVSKDGIEKELLQKSGLGLTENSLIFKRINTELVQRQTPQADLRNAVDSLLKKNRFSSVMSMNRDFPFLTDRENVEIAYNWFANELQIVKLNAIPTAIINRLYRDREFYNYTNKTLNNIHLGIKDVSVEFNSLEEMVRQGKIDLENLPSKKLEELSENSGISKYKESRPQYDIIVEDGVKKIGEMIFHQIGVQGYVGDMDVLSQSDGTLRLLCLMPAFFKVLQSRSTVLIDEINNCIHPNLIKALIRNYSESETKGQLIYTTHETELLDNDFMRSDEVWIANKHEGATDLYSINDFKEHRGLSMKRGYLDGRYGGIPITTLEKFTDDGLQQEGGEEGAF